MSAGRREGDYHCGVFDQGLSLRVESGEHGGGRRRGDRVRVEGGKGSVCLFAGGVQVFGADVRVGGGDGGAGSGGGGELGEGVLLQRGSVDEDENAGRGVDVLGEMGEDGLSLGV